MDAAVNHLRDAYEDARRIVAVVEDERDERALAWARALDRDESAALGAAAIEWAALSQFARELLSDLSAPGFPDERTVELLLMPDVAKIASAQGMQARRLDDVAYHDPEEHEANRSYHRDERDEAADEAARHGETARRLVDAVATREIARAAVEGASEDSLAKIISTLRSAEFERGRLFGWARRMQEGEPRFRSLCEAFDAALPRDDEW